MEENELGLHKIEKTFNKKIEETKAKILTRNNKFRKMVIQNSDNVSVAPRHSIVR